MRLRNKLDSSDDRCVCRRNDQENLQSCFTTTHGHWFVKRLSDGYAYIVSTSKDYPPCVAVESIDDLSATFACARGTKKHWFHFWKKGSSRTPSECCKEMTAKYNTVKEGSYPWMLMKEIDSEVRGIYDERIQALLEQMHHNIMGQLNNIENAQLLEKKSQECLELAELFKKYASQLNKKKWYERKSVWATATGAAVGAVGGLAAGGVAAPVAIPATIACAQGIESAVGATVGAGVAYAGYLAAKKTWFWSQQFVPLNAV